MTKMTRKSPEPTPEISCDVNATVHDKTIATMPVASNTPCDVTVQKVKRNKRTKKVTKGRENTEQHDETCAKDQLVVVFKVPTPKTRRARARKSLDDGTNRKLTEYFPVRRSTRKPESEQKADAKAAIRSALKTKEETGLAIVQCPVKGRCVHTMRAFDKNEFVVEYRGELVDGAEAEARENRYALDPDIGSYMYFFKHKERVMCVDATAESTYLGRLVNHSRLRPNCKMEVMDVDGVPHVYLVAKAFISANVELLYDYGDRSKSSRENCPWLDNS